MRIVLVAVRLKRTFFAAFFFFFSAILMHCVTRMVKEPGRETKSAGD